LSIIKNIQNLISQKWRHRSCCFFAFLEFISR